MPRPFRVRVAPGITVEQRVRPLDRVGCYVPGGRYPLPSSLLMTAIPARVAGVPEIVAVCPRPEPVVLAAAEAAGVTRLFHLGGAHAIAALAFGTETIPEVDRIVGPGNKYVAAAKTYVSARMRHRHAGRARARSWCSRIRGNPAWLAADLIAQAEHDPDARAVLMTSKARLATAVAREVARQMPADGPARAGACAPRRHHRHPHRTARRSRWPTAWRPSTWSSTTRRRRRRCGRAGAIFIGPHTAQVAGDYAIGSNHVLPTGGAARVRGGLHAADYVRVVSVQRVTAAGLRALAPTVRALALAEGLTAHAQSMM